MSPRDAPTAKEQFDEISQAASQAIEEARRIAYDLRPYHLDRLGLTQSLEEMIERVGASTPIRFTLKIPMLDGVFTKEGEAIFYRIVQESVSNIVKHSRATEAVIAIRREEDSVTLTIRDNGTGFSMADGERQSGGAPTHRSGFGLIGLAERVQHARRHTTRWRPRPITARPSRCRARCDDRMTLPIRVLIADDHPIFRSGLRQVIEGDGRITVVAEADDGQAALDALPACGAVVAILDVDMPVMDGFQVTQAIRERRLPVEVIILTMHKDARFLNAALDLGVKGYLVKDSAASDVINCIRAVADGREFVSPQLTGLLLKRGRGAAALRESTPGLDGLSPAERRVLRLVGEYKTSKEIADLLNLSVRTIEFHRASICEKLELKGAHALIKFAVQHHSEL